MGTWHGAAHLHREGGIVLGALDARGREAQRLDRGGVKALHVCTLISMRGQVCWLAGSASSAAARDAALVTR